MDQRLTDYIKQELGKGTTPDEIKKVLSAAGWRDSLIDEAFDPGVKTVQEIPAEPQPAPVLTAPIEPAVAPKESASLAFRADNLPQNSAPVVGQAPVVSQSVEAAHSRNNGGKRLLAVLCAALAAILVVGGGAAAYYFYFPTPKRVMGAMLDNLAKIKTEENEITIQTTITVKDPGLVGNYLGNQPSLDKNTYYISLDSQSSLDLSDAGDQKSAATMSIGDDTIFKDKKLQLDLVTLGRTLYFRVKNIPDLGFIDLSSLENQWITVNFDDYLSQMDPADAQKIKQTMDDQKITPEKISQIIGIYKQYPYLQITKSLPVAGEDAGTYHYQFVVDKTKLGQFLDQVYSMVTKQSPTSDELAQMIFLSAIIFTIPINGIFTCGRYNK